MTLPQIIVDLLTLLFDMAVPAAICTMVLAGIALRQEGGVNFQAGGRFQRWALWSVILLTLPQLLSWFAAQGIAMPAQGGGISSSWVASLQTSFSGFVSNVVVARLTPVLAAFCVLKAALDAAEGYSPLGSIVSAIFLLSASGTVQLFQSWNSGSQFATTDMLTAAWNFLAGTILPEAAGLAIVGAILQLRAPSAIHAAGGIGSCVLECFGHLEAGPGHGRLMRIGGDPVNLSNGLLNLTNWLGNVIMPTMAGLFAAAAIYRFSKAQPYSTPRLRGTGFSDVLWVVARHGVLQQPSILEQPRPLLDLNPDASELGWERSSATVRGWPGCARGRALCGVARTHDDRRSLGAQPGRSDVLFRTVGAVALRRILDSTRNGRSALGRSYEMPLQVTPVNRNLQTRVTFMLLELEDLFIVLGAAAIMNVVGHFVGGEIAGMPMSIVLQYGVPLLMVPVLMAFKYGKPRGYVRDLAFWYTKPHAYCALARDREIRSAYLREE